jgi:hypothetical protein
MKLAYWACATLLALPLAAPDAMAAQQGPSSTQGSSVADAAKAAREAKKDQPKATKVWDNDSIPNVPGQVNVVGQASEESASSETAAEGPQAGPTAGPSAPVDKSTLERQLGDAKEKLQSLQTDRDILQRTNTLDQQMYYGKPDYQSDAAGAKKLKDEQGAIDAKQQEIEDTQKEIAALQDKINSTPDAKPAEQAPSAPATNAPGSGGSSSAPAENNNPPQSGDQDQAPVQQPPPSS